jgi:hypothetical protein
MYFLSREPGSSDAPTSGAACIPWILFKWSTWDVYTITDGGKAYRRTQQPMQIPWHWVGSWNEFCFFGGKLILSAIQADIKTQDKQVYVTIMAGLWHITLLMSHHAKNILLPEKP